MKYPDTSETLDFLGLAEGGEVIHYEGLNAMTQKGLRILVLSKSSLSSLRFFDGSWF